MKTLLFLLSLTCSIMGLSQTYSSLIRDSEIENLVDWDLSNSEKRSEEQIGRKHLHAQIISWDTTIFINPKSQESWEKFIYLFKGKNQLDSLISEPNRNFMIKQCLSQKDTLWNSKFKNTKVVQNSRKNKYSYSIPIFSINQRIALIQKSFYCGNLCAYGGISVYIKNDEGIWQHWKTVNGWMS